MRRNPDPYRFTDSIDDAVDRFDRYKLPIMVVLTIALLLLAWAVVPAHSEPAMPPFPAAICDQDGNCIILDHLVDA